MKTIIALMLLFLTGCATTVERHGTNMRAKYGAPWVPVIYEKQAHESNPELSSLVYQEAPGMPREFYFFYTDGDKPEGGPSRAEIAPVYFDHYVKLQIDPDEARRLRWLGFGPGADALSTMFCLGKGGFIEGNPLAGARPPAGLLAAEVAIPWLFLHYLPSKDTPVWQSWGAGRKDAKYVGAARGALALKNIKTCT